MILPKLRSLTLYGFKLHLIINDRGELLALKLTPGNVDDRKPVPEMTEGIFGKLFGDRGYISQPEFDKMKPRPYAIAKK
ncbi:transposase family protein [Xenococcus sp. PCC 7305]|nr:transposase family protein [Xenococcus sp. PCC 7305]